MAIWRIEDLSPADLVGKFICEPSHIEEQRFGWPGQILSATAKRIRYVPLPRGEWLPDKKLWSAAARHPDALPLEVSRVCSLSQPLLVGDSITEVQAVFWAATQARRDVASFKRQLFQQLMSQALSGQLA